MTFGIGLLVAGFISISLIHLCIYLLTNFGLYTLILGIPLSTYALLLILYNMNQGFGSQYMIIIHFPIFGELCILKGDE